MKLKKDIVIEEEYIKGTAITKDGEFNIIDDSYFQLEQIKLLKQIRDLLNK